MLERPSDFSDKALVDALDGRLSLTGRRWFWQPTPEHLGQAIATRLGVPDLLGRLLAARGMTPETAGDFLEPTLRAYLPDPSSLLDMDKAAGRLADAVMGGETIGIFGDYDVDGACSAALMVTALDALGVATIAHVPHRLREGYGPNEAALKALADRGASLIVCVDCGAAAHAPLASIAGRADVVILDHHKLEGPPPDVVATVDPNRSDDVSGLSGMCAAGISFLALIATQRELRRRGVFRTRAEPDLRGLLDLVALATICDVMPLDGVNRALVRQGLRVMARRIRPGINALLDVADVKGDPTATTCGFVLGPRINAAGRIAEADLGLRTLLSADEATALPLARALDSINRERQAIEAGLVEEAIALARSQFDSGAPFALVTGADWHPGIVGIVAGRIKEMFNRPALVAGISAGAATGSGRSVPGIDLGAAVIAARDAGLVLRGGRHAMAAGFTVPAEGIEPFRQFLAERLAAAAQLPVAADLTLATTIGVPAATPPLAALLERMGPFGAGNAEPVLLLPHARVVKADRLGREGTTIRAIIEGEAGGRLKAMRFRAKDDPLASALLSPGGAPLKIAGHLRVDRWGGNAAAMFHVLDAAPA